ncbi:PaaI family thioesterase [Aquidulcibacter sp.]|uniref:PaaI family thioesterase n=1 Tax=Aquidulcibacter sp. TaxID=2052990 RepID=UPI0025C310DA|nr:PaaI family thioesterase [Aquidulcibacter sp.]MCA3694050.1 PaaI family thioesterase [Aquidulcibacter sp.]
MTNIPSGFSPHARKSPVTDPWQPLYARTDQGVYELGFILDTCHCNGRGLLHGGVIAALADNAMGLSLGMARLQQGQAEAGKAQAVSGIVTTSLQVDYIERAQIGQWISIVPRVVTASRRTGLTDALIYADNILIARAHASFKVLISETDT